jgi:hypothetical protein
MGNPCPPSTFTQRKATPATLLEKAPPGGDQRFPQLPVVILTAFSFHACHAEKPLSFMPFSEAALFFTQS